MNFKTILLLLAGAAIAGCSSAADNGNTVKLSNANMRGQNTNTGYVTNSETNVKPAMPANVTNISPPSMNSGNHNANHGTNTNTNSNKAVNKK